MWHSVNTGNWLIVEKFVRDLAPKISDLDVWTGGIGILTLPDHLGNEREIHLGVRATTKQPIIPAPMILFKYIYDSEQKRGLVFLTVNNPYINGTLPAKYQLCEEYQACNEINTHLKINDKGYTYCCLVDDFLKNPTVKELGLPSFPGLIPLI